MSYFNLLQILTLENIYKLDNNIRKPLYKILGFVCPC